MAEHQWAEERSNPFLTWYLCTRCQRVGYCTTGHTYLLAAFGSCPNPLREATPASAPDGRGDEVMG